MRREERILNDPSLANVLGNFVLVHQSLKLQSTLTEPLLKSLVTRNDHFLWRRLSILVRLISHIENTTSTLKRTLGLTFQHHQKIKEWQSMIVDTRLTFCSTVTHPYSNAGAHTLFLYVSFICINSIDIMCSPHPTC